LIHQKKGRGRGEQDRERQPALFIEDQSEKAKGKQQVKPPSMPVKNKTRRLKFINELGKSVKLKPFIVRVQKNKKRIEKPFNPVRIADKSGHIRTRGQKNVAARHPQFRVVLLAPLENIFKPEGAQDQTSVDKRPQMNIEPDRAQGKQSQPRVFFFKDPAAQTRDQKDLREDHVEHKRPQKDPAMTGEGQKNCEDKRDQRWIFAAGIPEKQQMRGLKDQDTEYFQSRKSTQRINSVIHNTSKPLETDPRRRMGLIKGKDVGIWNNPVLNDPSSGAQMPPDIFGLNRPQKKEGEGGHNKNPAKKAHCCHLAVRKHNIYYAKAIVILEADSLIC